MDQPSPSLRDLAAQLHAASRSASELHEHETVRVCGALQIALTKLAGTDGFKSLLSRALALARIEFPSLQCVKIGPDGRLEGFDQFARDAGAGAEQAEPAVAITAHLLQLLITFIGERLTLSLVREAWPHTSMDK